MRLFLLLYPLLEGCVIVAGIFGSDLSTHMDRLISPEEATELNLRNLFEARVNLLKRAEGATVYNYLYKPCLPDAYPNLTITGICSSLTDLRGLCYQLEISASVNTCVEALYEGNFCCYLSLFQGNTLTVSSNATATAPGTSSNNSSTTSTLSSITTRNVTFATTAAPGTVTIGNVTGIFTTTAGTTNNVSTMASNATVATVATSTPSTPSTTSNKNATTLATATTGTSNNVTTRNVTAITTGATVTIETTRNVTAVTTASTAANYDATTTFTTISGRNGSTAVNNRIDFEVSGDLTTPTITLIIENHASVTAFPSTDSGIGLATEVLQFTSVPAPAAETSQDHSALTMPTTTTPTLPSTLGLPLSVSNNPSQEELLIFTRNIASKQASKS